MPSPAAGPVHEVDTLVVGAGQAGLATSYWLSRAGVEHQLLDSGRNWAAPGRTAGTRST